MCGDTDNKASMAPPRGVRSWITRHFEFILFKSNVRVMEFWWSMKWTPMMQEMFHYMRSVQPAIASRKPPGLLSPMEWCDQQRTSTAGCCYNSNRLNYYITHLTDAQYYHVCGYINALSKGGH